MPHSEWIPKHSSKRASDAMSANRATQEAEGAKRDRLRALRLVKEAADKSNQK